MTTGQVSVDWNGSSWTLYYERDGEGVHPLDYERDGFRGAEPPQVVEDLLARAVYEPI
jgi:hypothetical protein